jgi:hypothetical protein
MAWQSDSEVGNRKGIRRLVLHSRLDEEEGRGSGVEDGA